MVYQPVKNRVDELKNAGIPKLRGVGAPMNSGVGMNPGARANITRATAPTPGPNGSTNYPAARWTNPKNPVYLKPQQDIKAEGPGSLSFRGTDSDYDKFKSVRIPSALAGKRTGPGSPGYIPQRANKSMAGGNPTRVSTSLTTGKKTTMEGPRGYSTAGIGPRERIARMQEAGANYRTGVTETGAGSRQAAGFANDADIAGFKFDQGLYEGITDSAAATDATINPVTSRQEAMAENRRLKLRQGRFDYAKETEDVLSSKSAARRKQLMDEYKTYSEFGNTGKGKKDKRLSFTDWRNQVSGEGRSAADDFLSTY